MKLSVDFGRWTATKAALAVAGALAIAGAIGNAVAFSPTIVPPIRWQGGAEGYTATTGEQTVRLYAVPPGRNFLLTDLVVANLQGTAADFRVYAHPSGFCPSGGDGYVLRLATTVAPPVGNTVLGFQTGIGFGAGSAVCVNATAELVFNGRGFLFTPN